MQDSLLSRSPYSAEEKEGLWTSLRHAVDANTLFIFNFLYPNASLDNRVVDIWTVQHLTAQLNKGKDSVKKALGLTLGKHKTKGKLSVVSQTKDDMEEVVLTTAALERKKPPLDVPPTTQPPRYAKDFQHNAVPKAVSPGPEVPKITSSKTAVNLPKSKQTNLPKLPEPMILDRPRPGDSRNQINKTRAKKANKNKQNNASTVVLETDVA